MRLDSVGDVLREAREVLAGDESELSNVLLKELLVNVLRLRGDELDTLDLKIMNRSLRELRHAFKVFKPYRHVRKVSIFGSARTPKEDPCYRMAVEFSSSLARRGFMVITGAAEGIMKAGNEGAGAERSFGVNILLPKEQGPNEFIVDDPKLVTFKYFFTRKLLFVMESSAVALFPGGFGTHDEGFETLTLLQTEKASPRPLLLFDLPDGDYWTAWDEFVRGQLLGKGFISEEDTSLYKIVRSVEEGLEEIEFFYSTYNSIRQVKDKLVIRMERELGEEDVRKLSTEFSDIIQGGQVEAGSALPDEKNEPELMSKPRLILAYNHESAGRLLQLVRRINELGARQAG